MTKEELTKLLVWAYQEGYKSAMAVIADIASDRSQDAEFTKRMEEQLGKVLEKKSA